MNTSVNKKNLEYLSSFGSNEMDQPQEYTAWKDDLDQLMETENLKIQQVYFNKELDLILILLNTSRVLTRPISDFPRLAMATDAQLLNYEHDGYGIHWLDLDEDLSLKGFLRYEMGKVFQRVIR